MRKLKWDSDLFRGKKVKRIFITRDTKTWTYHYTFLLFKVRRHCTRLKHHPDLWKVVPTLSQFRSLFAKFEPWTKVNIWAIAHFTKTMGFCCLRWLISMQMTCIPVSILWVSFLRSLDSAKEILCDLTWIYLIHEYKCILMFIHYTQISCMDSVPHLLYIPVCFSSRFPHILKTAGNCLVVVTKRECFLCNSHVESLVVHDMISFHVYHFIIDNMSFFSF